MTDDRELDALDPYDLLDGEAARLDRHFSSLDGEAWARPSRCEGWSVRDVLGHLAATEVYHHACLEGNVGAVFAQMAERGVTDLHSANALGVAEQAKKPVEQVLAEWREANAWTRREFRAHDGGDIDTSVGAYPCRWQAFHIASELATHADDAHVPVTDDERADRRGWRARFSRFALAEAKPDAQIEVRDGRTVVARGGRRVEVGDDELIEGVAGRLDEASGLTPEARALLSTMP